jgi:hypothetical protein
VPPFHKIFEIETKISTLQQMHMMVQFENENGNQRQFCCMPKYYRQTAEYERKNA